MQQCWAGEEKKYTTIWIAICSCQSFCSRLPGGCWTTLRSHQVSLTMPTGFLFPEPGWEAQIPQQPCKPPSAEESVPGTRGAVGSVQFAERGAPTFPKFPQSAPQSGLMGNCPQQSQVWERCGIPGKISHGHTGWQGHLQMSSHSPGAGN